MTASAVTTELQRGSVPRPDHPAMVVPLFASWESAIAHLRDHVLTAPECQGWALVLGEQAGLPSAEDGKDRQRLAEEAWASRGLSVQSLFDHYAQAIRQASHDAAVLTWYASEGAVTVGLGTAGVLLLIDGGILRTAFLPGQGDPQAVRHAGEKESALPRERGMRPWRGDRHPREQRQHRRRQESWSPDERLYYLVFRPTVQHIRSRYHSCRDASGRLLRCDHALLNAVLPPMSQLTIALWQEHRCLCGYGDST